MAMIRQTVKDKALRILAHRRFPAILVIIALLLVLPSIWTGWQMDDITHRYFLLGNRDLEGKTVSAIDMFAFVPANPARTMAMVDIGLMPWWTLGSLQVSFWRPLTGITHWLDYTLWPDNAVFMHLQSLAWFGILIAVAALLYRRFLGATWIAGLAGLFYAIDDAHGLPAGWLAGRNTVIASLIGILVLLVHDQWRRKGWQPGIIIGPLLLGAGLLAGEFVLGSLAYLFAYMLFIDPSKRLNRILTLVPYGVVTAVWLLAYRMLGHGTYGSGYYVDPMSEPFAFAFAFVQRGSILLLDQFGFPPADVTLLLSGEQTTVLWLVSVAFLSLLVWLFFPLLRNDPMARFWGTGLVASLLPITATLPNGRMLFFVGLGAMGLIAQWIAVSSGNRNTIPGKSKRKLINRLMLFILLTVHLVIAPLLLPIKSVSAKVGEPLLQKAAESIPDDPDIVKKDIIFVNPPRVFFANFTAAVRILNHQTLPQRFRSLASGSTKIRITRSGERTLVVRPETGFLADPLDQLFRGPSHPMRPGTAINLTHMTVRVISTTSDGRPDEVMFEFSKPLEDPSLLFLLWDNHEYVVFDLPPVGSSVDILPTRLF